jgi:hypothetical protein
LCLILPWLTPHLLAIPSDIDDSSSGISIKQVMDLLDGTAFVTLLRPTNVCHLPIL